MVKHMQEYLLCAHLQGLPETGAAQCCEQGAPQAKQSASSWCNLKAIATALYSILQEQRREQIWME